MDEVWLSSQLSLWAIGELWEMMQNVNFKVVLSEGQRKQGMCPPSPITNGLQVAGVCVGAGRGWVLIPWYSGLPWSLAEQVPEVRECLRRKMQFPVSGCQAVCMDTMKAERRGMGRAATASVTVPNLVPGIQYMFNK